VSTTSAPPSDRGRRERVLPVLGDLGLVVVCWFEGFTNQTAGWNRPFVLSVLALVAVLLRRRIPLLAFLLGVPALGWAQSTLAPAVLAFTLAHRERRGPVVVGAVVVGVGIDAAAVLDPRPGLWRADVAVLLQVTALLAGAAALGAYRAARGDLRDRLAELVRARSREHELVDAAARAQERTRLAREMHDVVSHQVSLIAIAAGALRVGDHPPAVRSAAEQIRALAVRTTDELRQMLTALRSDGRQPLHAPGRLADLPALWATSGVAGTFEVDPALLAQDELTAVPEGLQRTAFRVAQEGLTNARRHAPGAAVHLRVALASRRLTVSVVNAPPRPGTSRPGAVPGTGHGLLGVEERVAAARGTLAVGPTADGGFHLDAAFPLPAAQALQSASPLAPPVARDPAHGV
jgi:signal transduction histidine kinase